MADIKVGYTTSDYFYTLEPEKVPSHQTCEANFNIQFEDASCGFFTLTPQILSLIHI